MKLIQKDGSLCIQDDAGKCLIENISCGVRFNQDGAEFFTAGAWQISGAGDKWTASCADAEIRISEEKDGCLISSRFRCPVSHKDAREFVMLRGKQADGFKKAFGFKKDPCRQARMLTMQSDWQQTDFADEQSMEFAEHAQAELTDGKSWLGGFVTVKRYFSLIDLYADGAFEARQVLEHHPVAAGEWLESDVFWFRTGSSPVSDQETYCDICSAMMGGARRKFKAPSGYCTWYYYMEDVTGAEVLANLAAVKREKESGGLPLEYVQIDCGWFDCTGDWNANEKFPEGMKFYADRIAEAGFIPGIWFIPFGANDTSAIFKEHQEYFTRRWDSDEPAVEDGRAQWDYSQPEARKYLADLVRKFTYEWGYRYIKLDIVSQTLGAERYAEPSFNSVQNYRECLKIIQDNIPEDTFVLGCTAPYTPSIGLVDAMRIGPDVVPEWKRVREPYSQVLNHFALNGRFFISDADCIEVRSKENEDSLCTMPSSLTTEEKQLYSSALAAAGGTFMTCDKLGLLSKAQLELLNLQFPLENMAARPVDFGQSSNPSILDAGERNGVRRVMFLNWGEEEKSFSWDCPGCHAFDFWQKVYLGIMDRYEVRLAPHHCKVMFFADVEKCPGIIGCDDVILPSFSAESKANSLMFNYAKPGESLWMALPEGCKPKLDGGILKQETDTVWRCTADAQTDISHEIHLTW